MTNRPFSQIQLQIQQYIEQEYTIKDEMNWTLPPNSDLGDISFPLFSLAKKTKLNSDEIGEKIKTSILNNKYVENVIVERGFLNIYLNKKNFAKEITKQIMKKNLFDLKCEKEKERIVVEHTSSNPNNALHIGNFRGSVIGDVLARLYKELGATVNVRYFINDLGRQIAPVVIGYSLLKEKKVKPDTKIDLWIGKIYACMNNMLDIQETKRKILALDSTITIDDWYSLDEQEAETIEETVNQSELNEEEKNNLIKQLSKHHRIHNSLFEKIPSLYELLQEELLDKEIDLSKLTLEYIDTYQKGGTNAIVETFRELTELALSGHIETLKKFNIHHDDYDRESDVMWSGEVEEILTQLDSKGWLRHDGKARLLKSDELASTLRYKELYNIHHEIPELILVNSEGIPLYPCRDIAYHLHKLEKIDGTFCYNVIGKQQQQPQMGLKIALYGLNKQDIADKIIHLDYEYVSLVGRKMAGRELEYVTPDELIELAYEEVLTIMEDREIEEREKKKIAEAIATSSIKYFILKMDPQKTVVFEAKKATSPTENTGTFLLYTYTRATNILKKAKGKGYDLQQVIDAVSDLSFTITEDEEWDLIKSIDELPRILTRAIETLRPDTVANYTYDLAKTFTKFYEICQVLGADSEDTIKFRLVLVYITIKALDSLFEVMGISKITKM